VRKAVCSNGWPVIAIAYRNRMVHFYHEVTQEELYRICAEQLGDIERVVEAFKQWMRDHPERIDEAL
jgi:uncharacterized protein YutE (UPF0331/DUF86 family)